MLANTGCQPSDTKSGAALAQVGSSVLVQRGLIHFIADSTRGRQLAKQQGLPCLLFFTAEWCTYCRQMETTTFADPTISKLAQRFVCVLVDADREPEVCRQFAIDGYPTVQFLTNNGRSLHRLVGRQPPREFAAGMQAALERFAWLEHAESLRR